MWVKFFINDWKRRLLITMEGVPKKIQFVRLNNSKKSESQTSMLNERTVQDALYQSHHLFPKTRTLYRFPCYLSFLFSQ